MLNVHKVPTILISVICHEVMMVFMASFFHCFMFPLSSARTWVLCVLYIVEEPMPSFPKDLSSLSSCFFGGQGVHFFSFPLNSTIS